MKKLFAYISGALLILNVWVPSAFAQTQKAATLYVGPSTGSFTVGSTFTVSFYVNTGNQFINVVDADILFPADKLQVVSPSTGSSFINVWAIQPSYSNSEGTMSFRGAVPSPGISTSAGLISTVTFRVKSVGTAAIRFGSRSKVLLNDGLGTDILQQTQSGVYTLMLPPPSGPIVTSSSNPDQARWYSQQLVSLSWAGDAGASGYSYVISAEPVDAPDNIVDGHRNSITYSNLPNGRNYFHIKALRDGVWGGVTHFAINIDTELPASFPVSIIPSARTAQHQPVIKFFTTDSDSGLDHYEIKLIPLGAKPYDNKEGKPVDNSLFTETQSPHIPSTLDFGRYDVYVRAYDAAGNYREELQRLDIVPSLFEVIQGQGIEFKNILFIPWSVFWGIALLILLILGVIARKMHWWHRSIDTSHAAGALPSDIGAKLQELKRFQEKYGKVASVFLLIMLVSTMVLTSTARAESGLFAPPVITTVSKDIFNDEIFYAGGRSSEPSVEVILYLQRLEDGQTSSYHVSSDAKGYWFYRHGTFLQTGSYLIWAQAEQGEQLSPPSPQVAMMVASHALQLGTSRFSYEAIYFIAMLLLALIVLILSMAIWYHYHHGKQKHTKFSEEKAKIEESIRRGFALLRRDIEEEMELLSYSKLNKDMSRQEKEREEQLLRDLETVKRQIGEEVWELEKLGE
jgi:hypothetical protein